MNKPCTFERWIRLFAFVFSLLLYVTAVGVIWLWADRLSDDRSVSVSVNAVNLSFAQMELAEETPQPSEEPEPEIVPEPEEQADVVLEEVVEKEPEPEPEPELMQGEAQVTQAAAAPELAVNTEGLQAWIFEQIEKEKYYPRSAQRAGLEGSFDVMMTVDADGTILSAEILSGEGHLFLRHALEKTLKKLLGREFGRPLGQAVEIPMGVDFDLQ